MYDSDLDAYLLTADQFSRLQSYADGWEAWDMEGSYHVVNIWDDDILQALNLGPYHGGGIDINNSHQGGTM